MAVIEMNEDVYGWCSRVACIITFIMTAIALGFHLHAIHDRTKNRQLDITPSLVFSIILQMFVILLATSWIINAYSNVTDVSICQKILHPSIIGYICVKWSLYMFLSFRLGMHAYMSLSLHQHEKMQFLRFYFTLDIVHTAYTCN